MVISASSSSTTRMRQYRRQMKKTKVLRGFTNQLKEVLGRLLGKGGVTVTRKLLPVTPPSKAQATYLGFSRGSGSFRPFPTGRFSASSTVSSSNSASTFP